MNKVYEQFFKDGFDEELYQMMVARMQDEFVLTKRGAEVSPPTPTPVLSTDITYAQSPAVSNIFDIKASAEKQFFFRLPRDTNDIRVTMSSADWASNCDLIVSPSTQPKTKDVVGRSGNGPIFWFGFIGTSNESITIRRSNSAIGGTVIGASQHDFYAGSVIYVTVVNRSLSPGKIRLYWNIA